jgi:hypothetical protein
MNPPSFALARIPRPCARAVPLLGMAGAGIAMMTALVMAPGLAAEELA